MVKHQPINVKEAAAHYAALTAEAAPKSGNRLSLLSTRDLLFEMQECFLELNSRAVFGCTALDDKFAVAETALDELVHGAREYLDGRGL